MILVYRNQTLHTILQGAESDETFTFLECDAITHIGTMTTFVEYRAASADR
jgi:hypothetical protein